MPDPAQVLPIPTKQLTDLRAKLAPEALEGFKAFNKSVFADGAIDGKTKQLIAVAVAHATRCPYCIRGHTKSALQKGATPEQIMEAIWVASEMLAGATYAHSLVALEAIADAQPSHGSTV